MPEYTPFRLNPLGEIPKENTAQDPQGTAVLQPGKRLTWSEINERTNRLANGLLAKGLTKGDRIAFLLRNRSSWIETTFAALKTGTVLVPLSYRMAAGVLKRILQECRPSVLVLHDDFLDLGLSLSPNLAGPAQILLVGGSHTEIPCYEKLIRESDDRDPVVNVSGKDLAYITFTSGTTGFPKGVMWTHEALLSTVEENPFPRELCLHSRQMVLAPSFVAGSQIQILNGACNAATLILQEFDPREVMQNIEKEEPTLMASAAVMLRMLAALPDAMQYDTSSLKRIYYGGASMGSRRAFEEIRKLFPCDFQQGYGSAETCILVSRLDPEDHRGPEEMKRPERLLSAGRTPPGTNVKILDQQGREVEGENEVGVVAVKAPWLMKGYWNNPEETAKAFNEEGYYLTGDMATMDRDGYLFLVDRKDDMIKTGGLNVFPGDVEAVIASHPAVEETAVIGLAHPRWEKAVVAVVRLNPVSNLEEKELRDFCRKALGAYKVPKAFFFTPTPLPRNSLGKVERKALKASYEEKTKALWQGEASQKQRSPDRDMDPLRHCRKCEFQEVCEKFCSKYFE